MSHFPVLVIGSTESDNVETSLAPYQENNMGDCPQEYLEFEDETETVTSDWEDGTSTMVRLTDGTLKNKYSLNESERAMLDSGILKEEEIPYKEIYKDIDIFADEYHGYKKEDGKYGYYTNPNSRWDWYEVGGRWAGSLLLKTTVNKSTLPQPNFSWGWSQEDRDQALNKNVVDVARLCDIDLEQMTLIEDKKVRAQYNAIRTWNALPSETDEEKKFKNKSQFDAGIFFMNAKKFEDALNLDEESFVKKYVEHPLAFHSIVDDGEWYEKGTMGWFACISDEMDMEDWNKIVAERIATLDPNTIVTVVDCHV